MVKESTLKEGSTVVVKCASEGGIFCIGLVESKYSNTYHKFKILEEPTTCKNTVLINNECLINKERDIVKTIWKHSIAVKFKRKED